MTKPIPDGYSSLTANLTVGDGAAALDFYTRAFGAEVVRRITAGDLVVHSELRIDGSLFTVTDAMPEYGIAAPEPDGPVHASMLLFCEDVDARFARAVEAGATELNPVSDTFHGDRAGSLRDPFGHRWTLATHQEDMSEAEMQRRTDEFMAQAQSQ
jgi:PhnB protein